MKKEDYSSPELPELDFLTCDLADLNHAIAGAEYFRRENEHQFLAGIRHTRTHFAPTRGAAAPHERELMRRAISPEADIESVYFLLGRLFARAYFRDCASPKLFQ
jgi:hypothetical protein